MDRVPRDDGPLPDPAGLVTVSTIEKRMEYSSIEEYTGEPDFLQTVRAHTGHMNIPNTPAGQIEILRDSIPYNRNNHEKIRWQKLHEDTVCSDGEAPLVSSSLILQSTPVADKCHQEMSSRHGNQIEQRFLPNAREDSNLPDEKAPILQRLRELAVSMSSKAAAQDTRAGNPLNLKQNIKNESSSSDHLSDSRTDHIEVVKAEASYKAESKLDPPEKELIATAALRMLEQYRPGSSAIRASKKIVEETALGLSGLPSDLPKSLGVKVDIAALRSSPSGEEILLNNDCATRATTTMQMGTHPTISKSSFAQVRGGVQMASAHEPMSGKLSTRLAGTVTGRNDINDVDEERHTNGSPTENIRPAQQNLRYGAYPGQPAPQPRNTPLGTARLQNSSNKIGNGTAWGFGAQANGALPSAQPRSTGVGSTSFAQTIGRSQPAASLDITDFPSLGPTSQSQYQSTSQSIWANQRAAQQTPVQRPQQQQQHAISSQASQQRQQTHHAQDQAQRVNDGVYSSTSHLHGGIDDDRYHNTLGQISTARQPSTTNVDDFPPLGRHGTDDIDDRRGSIMQNAGFGAFSNVNAFSLPQDQQQSRNALPSASGSQSNNTRSPSAMDRITSPNGIGFGSQLSGRSLTETNRQGISGVQDHDRNHVSPTQANPRHEHTLNALLTHFDTQFPPHQQGSQSSHIQHEYGGRTGDPGSAHTPDRPQMSAMDEFGLPGFLATIRSDNPDVAGLARGQDLTSLGLNLNSPEPLWPTFAGPFAEPGSRPMQPDYVLPECYTVDNVNRVKDKIPGFSDETLFWIFYTQTQDILQEFAASELTVRNWRFHKEHQMWLTKNPTLGEPISMGPEKENGSYVFFNHNTWEKMNLSNFDLHYSQLAPPISTVRPNNGQ